MPVSKPERSQWVDIAKAVSILLVVFHHSSASFTPAMHAVDQVLLFFRMPLFFFASGLFLKKMMKYDFAALAGRRLAPLLYLYVAWSILKWAVITLRPYLKGDDVDPTTILRIFWEPQATLWFIYALAIYSLIAWSLRRAPTALVTFGALALSALALAIGPVTDGPFVLRIGRFFLWFWLGYVLRDQVAALVRQHFRWPFLLAVPAWGAGCYYLTTSGANLHLWALPLTGTALGAGLILAAGLERTPLSGPLAALGRNTLPVYVAHFFPLLLLASHPLPFVATPSWTATLLSIALAVAFSFAAKLLADRVWLGWLYELPRSARQMMEEGLRKAPPKTVTMREGAIVESQS